MRSAIPPDQFGAVLEATRLPDSDRRCIQHRASGREEAWALAADALRKLRDPRPRTPRVNAQLLGSYFHYVADCAMPRMILGSDQPTISLSAYDLVIFRLPARPLGADVAAELERRAAESLWADPVTEVAGAAFREAVALTIDAAAPLGVPAAPQGAAAPSPVLFVFNKVDVLPRKMRPESLAASGDPMHMPWAQKVAGIVPNSDPRFPTLFPSIARRNVQVIEWVPRTEGGQKKVRALLFNCQADCVKRVTFENEKWSASVPVRLEPMSLASVELSAPAFSPDDVRAYGLRGACGGEPSPGGISTAWSYVWQAHPVNAPDFGKGGVEVRLPPSPRRENERDVDFDLSADPVGAAVKNLRLKGITIREESAEWVLDVELEALAATYRRVALSFEVEVDDGRGGKTVRSAKVNPRTMEHFGRFEATIPDRPARYSGAHYRLLSVKVADSYAGSERGMR